MRIEHCLQRRDADPRRDEHEWPVAAHVEREVTGWSAERNGVAGAQCMQTLRAFAPLFTDRDAIAFRREGEG